jgi:aspartate racemase
MVSVDCDRYVQLLTSNKFADVDAHLLSGVAKIVNAGCNLLAIASNTGHICVPAVREAYPELDIVHIADCAAAEMLRLNISKVGLIGTKPTMEEDYLKSRLALHNIAPVIPESPGVRDQIYDIICQELSFNVLRNESRDFMVDVIRGLKSQGAEACLLGCTEIELLVKQDDVPDVHLLPSAQIHIDAIVDILLKRRNPDDLLPAT